jgi:hypothetical protein
LPRIYIVNPSKISRQLIAAWQEILAAKLTKQCAGFGMKNPSIGTHTRTKKGPCQARAFSTRLDMVDSCENRQAAPLKNRNKASP